MSPKDLFSLVRRKKITSEASTSQSPTYGLFFLNEQQFNDVMKGGEAKYSIDIVAVHGIDGDAYRTWTHRNGKMWLKDFLPDLLPGARIFTFGYPSEVAFTLATGQLGDFARSLLEELNCVRSSSEQLSRRIIFVCHSMGGIVVKQAIITALIDAEDYANVRDSVTGILFLGTPHRGSSAIELPLVLANIANVTLIGATRFTGRIRANLLKSLKKDSGILNTISTDFRNSALNIKIISFIEQKPTLPLKQRVVDEVSGVMNVPKETIVPMDDCDHGDICRFSDPTNSGFRKVCSHLEKLGNVSRNASNVANVPDLSSPSRKTVFTVPFERDTKFIGREDIITEIDRRFVPQGRVALAGIGGIGKSQIAIEYCYRFRARHRNKHVFWVHASTFSRMDQAYKDIAKKLNIPGCSDPNLDTFHLVSEWLNNDTHGGWLLVLDNADDKKVFFSDDVDPSSVDSENTTPLAKFLPHGSHGSILITTRDKRLGESLANREKAIIVVPMAGPESKTLLWSKISEENILDKTKSVELLETLEYLPLAITQAAAYMNENNITIEAYLEVLHAEDSETQDLLSEDLVDLRRDFESQSSVIRTWKVSFDQIKKQKPRAAEILSLMAVLDRQGIPKTLLRKDEESGNEFITALGTLQAFSLISAEKGGESFEIHRLVQVSTRRWLELQGEISEWRGLSLQILAAAFPSGRHQNRAICEALYPHAQAVIRHKFIVEQELLLRADLLTSIFNYEYDMGRYDIAYKNILEVFSLHEKLQGPEHIETILSMYYVALMLNAKGEYVAAEKMQRQVLEIFEKEYGSEHNNTLNSRMSLATILISQGKYEAAEAMQLQTIELQKQVLGSKHLSTLISRNELARVLAKLKKYEASEQLHRETIALFEETFGSEYRETLNSRNNLAVVLAIQGKYEEAKDTYQQVLEAQEQVFGPKHPDTILTKNNLAILTCEQGKLEEAEDLCRQVIELREQVLGSTHPHTLSSKVSLAYILGEQSKLEEAVNILRQATELQEQVLGSAHPDTVRSREELEYCLETQRKANIDKV